MGEKEGAAPALGDVDGDGFDDLVICRSKLERYGPRYGGVVRVRHGSEGTANR